jgi:hypothetical protein
MARPEDLSEPHRASGQRWGGETLVGSDVDPERFTKKDDPTVEVWVYSGLRVKRRYTLARSRLPQAMARHAGNRVRARAIETMSGDEVGGSFTVSGGFNKPRRWVSYPG